VRTAATALPLALALAALASVQGCRQERPAAEARRYTVRGEVVKAADPGAAQPEVMVRHEAIADFTDSDGKVVGMASMVMPFAVVPASLARELAVGDKVEIRFTVDWKGPSFVVERIDELPPATELR
jgi:Cu/Ag efflux protein CusF